jgi:hypothetical protein
MITVDKSKLADQFRIMYPFLTKSQLEGMIDYKIRHLEFFSQTIQKPVAQKCICDIKDLLHHHGCRCGHKK